MTTERTDIPVFPWFDRIPEELRERWRTGWAALFDREAAVPKRALTEAQRAAVARLAVKRRTCPGCGTVGALVLPDDYELRDCPTCARRQVEQDRAAASAVAAKALADPRAVVLDLETTSLGGYAVESAVIDMTGAVLLEERILRVLLDHHPRALDRKTLAQRAGQSPRSSAFGNHLNELREAGLIDEPQAGQVVATALLFPTFKEHR